MLIKTPHIFTGFLALKIAFGNDFITPLPASANFNPTEPLTMVFLGFVLLGFAKFCRERFGKIIDNKRST